MAAAKQTAEAALDAVPERSNAKAVWTCGAAIGDDAYVAFNFKELEGKYFGSETDANKGELLTIDSELAVVDPHAAHAAIQYTPLTRVDWVMRVHLPEETKSLARGRRPHTPRVLRLCLGAGPLDPERAFEVTGTPGLRARALGTPGQMGRRWLRSSGGARVLLLPPF